MKLLLGSGGFSTPERRKSWIECFDTFLGPIRNVLFIPYAIKDYDTYVKKMIELGYSAGRVLRGIHEFPNPAHAIEEANAIYVGGGNTFRLTNSLYEFNLIEAIQKKISKGVPYIGVSAGTNVSCPTMMTTNDMPIVQPASFKTLGLVSFQINAHYFSGTTYYKEGADVVPYGGETRDDRLREFHEMNDTPILGLCEGSAIEFNGDEWLIHGYQPRAVWFQKGQSSKEIVESKLLNSCLRPV